MELKRVDVEVIAKFSPHGGMTPLAVVWEDGRRFPVDCVMSVTNAPERVASVLPVRYTCVIRGRKKFLYFEPKRRAWFVEVEA